MNHPVNISKLLETFHQLYPGDGRSPEIYFAPGRVNLIGEHTDYNNGYVFPCALTYGTYLLVRRTNRPVLHFATTNFSFRKDIPLDHIGEKVGNEWVNYPLGVINQFVQRGVVFNGMEMLFSGTVPNGAGLSSSASIEMVMAVAINEMYRAGFPMVELALIGQRAENEFVGMNCGIMDQFASGLGKENAALFLNCDTLQYELVPLDLKEYRLVISNTNKRRGLTDSKYNERRSECDRAVEYISRKKKIEHLSQLSYHEFESLQEAIPDPTVRKRARHVISENQRVLEAVLALKSGDLKQFGQLMNESHDSLRDDYEVTGKELDTLVSEARKIKGVLGSRMTGAGFGGCTVSIVHKDMTNTFIRQVGKNYEKATGLKPDFYLPDIGGGAGKLQ